jgi:hypothetical protein
MFHIDTFPIRLKQSPPFHSNHFIFVSVKTSEGLQHGYLCYMEMLACDSTSLKLILPISSMLWGDSSFSSLCYCFNLEIIEVGVRRNDPEACISLIYLKY